MSDEDRIATNEKSAHLQRIGRTPLSNNLLPGLDSAVYNNVAYTFAVLYYAIL